MAGKSDNAESGSAPATPKAGAGGGGFSSLTAREQEILAKSMTCLKAQPEIDFDKLASELGMTNPRSAVNAWSQIKRKMGWNLKAPASPAGGKAPNAGKRKKAASNENEGDDEEDDTGTPGKRAKVAAKPRKKAAGTPKKGKPAVATKDESEEDKVSSDDKADNKVGVKEEQVDGEV